MSNAFHWRGQPSIFTTGAGQQAFTGADTVRGMTASAQFRPQPVSLPGSLFRCADVAAASRGLREEIARLKAPKPSKETV